MEDIDFVLPWVDGADLDWLAQKRKYENSGEPMSKSDADANADCRYRDFGLMRYWFRSVERYAPWVRKVFFVTCGQKPEWLDESCPRLRLVNHADYIPADYLPTFQSNTIELNLHRIPGLSERFVLFNRIYRALKNLKNIGNLSDVSEMLRSQAENDESHFESSYGLLYGIVWAIPILGALTTILSAPS